jgi:hypothetical protein
VWRTLCAEERAVYQVTVIIIESNPVQLLHAAGPNPVSNSTTRLVQSVVWARGPPLPLIVIWNGTPRQQNNKSIAQSMQFP